MGLAIWMMALIGVVIFGFLYFVEYTIFDVFGTSLSNIFPQTFNQDWFVFVSNYWWWMPLVFILIGLTYWVFVQSQKELQVI